MANLNLDSQHEPHTTTPTELVGRNFRGFRTTNSFATDATVTARSSDSSSARSRSVERSSSSSNHSNAKTDWHLITMQVDKIHEAFKQINVIPGAGVTIAHPDSGMNEWQKHFALKNSKVDENRDMDFVDRDDDAIIAGLDGGTHGLKTASVIVGKHDGDKGVHGIAPGAVLIPLRVTRVKQSWWDFLNPFPSPVLGTGGVSRLTKAIDYAVMVGADVISISLGTPKALSTNELSQAVKNAYNAGIIVVAAAGNYSLYVDVYPAAYSSVISCAACGPDGQPWQATARGNHVDILAPGHNIYRASFNGKIANVLPGSGTSYAAANVAGVACLWFSKFGGRLALIKQAKQAGYPYAGRAVVDTFRTALASTATRLNTSDFGYGLINAYAALNIIPFAHSRL